MSDILVRIGPVKFCFLLNLNSTCFGCLSPLFIVQKNFMYYLGLICLPVEDEETQGRTHLAYIVYRIVTVNLELYPVVIAYYVTSHLIEFVIPFSVRHAAS